MHHMCVEFPRVRKCYESDNVMRTFQTTLCLLCVSSFEEGPFLDLRPQAPRESLQKKLEVASNNMQTKRTGEEGGDRLKFWFS